MPVLLLDEAPLDFVHLALQRSLSVGEPSSDKSL